MALGSSFEVTLWVRGVTGLLLAKEAGERSRRGIFAVAGGAM